MSHLYCNCSPLLTSLFSSPTKAHSTRAGSSKAAKSSSFQLPITNKMTTRTTTGSPSNRTSLHAHPYPLAHLHGSRAGPSLCQKKYRHMQTPNKMTQLGLTGPHDDAHHLQVTNTRRSRRVRVHSRHLQRHNHHKFAHQHVILHQQVSK